MKYLVFGKVGNLGVAKVCDAKSKEDVHEKTIEEAERYWKGEGFEILDIIPTRKRSINSLNIEMVDYWKSFDGTRIDSKRFLSKINTRV